MKNLCLASRGLLPALLLVASLGCSFSNSSESSSDSVTSSSDSSGSSSGEKSTALQQDVEHYTVAYVKGGGRSADGFLSGLGELARRRGISDWEAAPGIWESVGRGLGDAHVAEADRHAYAQAWAAYDADRRQAIERGYAASR